MYNLTEIKSAVQSAIDQYGDPERRYTFTFEIVGTNIYIEIDYIYTIISGSGGNPTVRKDARSARDSMEECIPVSCNERVIKAFVRAMIEEIELTPIIYE